MKSGHAAAVAAAMAFLLSMSAEASACSCERITEQEKYSKADLVVRGRMKTVTYGIELPDPDASAWARATRGEFEIEKVLKGSFKEKTISIYTGAGMGDCGRLGDFLNAAFYYGMDEYMHP